MGDVKKINDEYYIEFFARGLKYQQKAGTDYAAALKLLEETEEKIRQGEMGVIVRDADVSIFLTDFLEYVQKKYSPATFRRYESLVKHFLGFFKAAFPNEEKLSTVTPKVIEMYKQVLIKKVKGRTVNFSLMLLRDVLEYARKLGYLNDNPALHIKYADMRLRSRFSNLSDDPALNLLKKTDKDLKYFVLLLRYTGVSPAEAVLLSVKDLDLAGGCVQVNKRTIPIDGRIRDDLTLVLKDKKPEDRFLSCDIQELLSLLREKSEGKVNPFMLRSLFVGELAEKGFSLSGITKLLGLSDIGKSSLYMELIVNHKGGMFTPPPHNL